MKKKISKMVTVASIAALDPTVEAISSGEKNEETENWIDWLVQFKKGTGLKEKQKFIRFIKKYLGDELLGNKLSPNLLNGITFHYSNAKEDDVRIQANQQETALVLKGTGPGKPLPPPPPPPPWGPDKLNLAFRIKKIPGNLKSEKLIERSNF